MDRQAWVTGAASGLGRAITRRLECDGVKVTALDIDANALSQLVRELPSVSTLTVDAGDSQALTAALNRIPGDRLDILINCVGIGGPVAAVEDTEIADWNRVIATDLTSHFVCAKTAVPRMKAAGGGAIVNIGSTSAVTGLPLRSAYVVAKAGVVALARNLARELGPSNIRVNAVLPGPMAGPRLDQIIADKAAALGVEPRVYEAEMLRFVSMGTTVTPEEVAETVAFLVSDRARHITGQTLAVDGQVVHEE